MPKPASRSLTVSTPTDLAPTSAPKRRTFTAADKLRIVQEANACTKHGELGALLRREGIYSSLLLKWRRALNLDGEKGLEPKKTGRPPKLSAHDQQLQELQRQNDKLAKDLELAHKLLALQKKVSELLSVTLPTSETE